MTFHYFKGYFDELNKLRNEKERLMKLKDRSVCQCCDSRISRPETDNKLLRIENLFEKLEIRKRKYNVKWNIETNTIKKDQEMKR